MPTIVRADPAMPFVTVINVFQVEPAHQAEALQRLVAVNHRIAAEPGWISASAHRSLDGRRVANYAQWRDEASIRAALMHPDLAPLLHSLGEIAEGDWHLYEVADVEEAAQGH